jgi:hypothetical protein
MKPTAYFQRQRPAAALGNGLQKYFLLRYLARYGHLEDIPEYGHRWDVPGLRGTPKLAGTLAEHRELAFLFRDLATLRTEPPVLAAVDALRWRGPTDTFDDFCSSIDAERTAERAEQLAKARR